MMIMVFFKMKIVEMMMFRVGWNSVIWKVIIVWKLLMCKELVVLLDFM